MNKIKVIPYHSLKKIIIDCPNKRTQAIMAFQYAMGNRIGELAKEYTHWKWKFIKKDKKSIRKGNPIISQGIRRDMFIETADTIEWDSPNFKNAKQPTKDAWVFKKEEEWLCNILKDWLDTHKEEKFLFNIRERRLRQLVDSELQRYNEDWSSHAIRHSRATHLGEVTENPYVVKQVLGHANLETSTRYVNISKAAIKSKLAGKRMEDMLGKEI